MSRILPGLAVALLFPVYYMCLHLAIKFEIPSSNATHTTRALAVVLMGLLFFFSNNKGQLQAKWSPLHLSILVFMLLYACRIFALHDETTWRLDSEYPFSKVSMLFIFGSIVPFVMAMFSTKLFLEESTSNIFIGLTFLSVIVVAAFSIDQFGVFRTAGFDSGSVSSLPMGYLAALSIAYCVLDFLRLRRFPIVILIIVLCCAIFLFSVSASRGPTLALVVTSVYLLITMKKTAYNIIGSSVFFCALVGASVWFFNYAGSGILTRIENTDEEEVRFDMYAEAFSIFESSPIIGKDIAVSDGTWPHNLVLEALMAVGIFGLLFIIPWIIALVKIFVDYKADNRQWLYLWFLQTSVMNMFSGSIWSGSSLFVCLCLVFAGGQDSSRTRSKKKRRRRKVRRINRAADEGF